MSIDLHPADHPPSELKKHDFDLIVLGAGSTGENVASRAIAGGLSVAVVEAELVGGDCSYWACMPSKGLLRSGEVLHDARRVGGAAEAVTGDLDVVAVLARRNKFNSGFDDASQVSWLVGAKATFVRGQGRLSGERKVTVTGADGSTAELTARHAVALCVGSAPAMPPIDGLSDVGAWTNREATSSETVPGHLIVLGGGVVGVEMAAAWSSLGSKITLLEGAGQLLPAYEPKAGELLGASLRDAGVNVRVGVKMVAARREGATVTVTLDGGEEISGDELLIAVGRKPKTVDVGLDTIGVEAGHWLEVDDSMTVTAVDGGWLYAVGDCNDRAKLTHIGKYEARVAGDVIAARAKGDADAGTPAPFSAHAATATHRAVAQVVFTDPQVGSVGLTEAAALDAGLTVRVVDYDMGAIAGSVLYADGYQGWANLVVDTDRNVVVGATFVGPNAGELVHAATVAVVGEVPLERLWHAVPSYPTISEIWLRLLETWGL
ncbi:MAG: NAD(P)/FAD-dependent oxidoreductase [Actinomycetota bacterium]|nr:NAD(P)/FAD-dependent oxidoreductase [Actinomycetota bacterium]